MAILVHNARTPLPAGHTPIYVGRKPTYRAEFGADFSILGNPYTIRKHGAREEALVLYRQWLPLRLHGDTPQARALEALVDRLRAGESLLLICWCAPLACHAEVIKQELERLMQA